MWDDHTALMAFGTTMWGLNRLAYGFGYWGYENPYYTEPYPVGGDVVIDYSQPIVVESTDPAATATLRLSAEPPAPCAIPLWDGHAAERAADVIAARFGSVGVIATTA